MLSPCRWISALVLGAAILLSVGASAQQCVECYDPPSNPWIRHTLTLTRILFPVPKELSSSDLLSTLDEPGNEEMVLLLQVTHFGACPNCSQTYVKYLPGFSADAVKGLEAIVDGVAWVSRGLEVIVDGVTFTVSECWPASRIAVKAAIVEENMGAKDVWELIRRITSANTLEMTGSPSNHPDKPWSVRLGGALYDVLFSELGKKRIDVVMPTVPWGYAHDGLDHLKAPKATDFPLRTPEGCWCVHRANGREAILFCFASTYDAPPGVSCAATTPPSIETQTQSETK